jgi:hypothetical protein
MNLTYTFDEFAKHMQEVTPLLREERHDGEASFERNVIRTMDYFKPLYPDEGECAYKHGRFCLMMHYMAHHVNDFDTGDYAVFGSHKVGALMSTHLLKAVHHVFTVRDLSEMKTDPTPEEIMALAEEFREEEPVRNP